MKILIYGQPKSGTTILLHRVRAGLEAQLGRPVASAFEPIRRESEQGLSIYRHSDGRVTADSTAIVVKALVGLNPQRRMVPEHARSAFTDFDARIFLLRDPRDRLISGFFYRWYQSHGQDPAEFERALRLTRHKEAYPDDLPFYALHSLRPRFNARQLGLMREELSGLDVFLRSLAPLDWHILRYEDLVAGRLEALEARLGFAVPRDLQLDGKLRRISRSNASGNWRRWFTRADVEFYKPLMTGFLARQGYDAEDWELENPLRLDPAEGSAYMLRIATEPDAPTA